MQKQIIYIIVLIFNFTLVYGQKYSSWINNWDKILLTDSYMGWSYYKNEYQILRTDLTLRTLNQPDSIIKQVNSELVDSLICSLINKKEIINDPLIMFNQDSTWFINNAENLWFEYNKDKKELPEVNVVAINTLKNYPKVKKSIYSLQGSHWTDDYPFVSVILINSNDTLLISSNGQYPYMLPWIVDNSYIFNSQVSSLIAQLLPDTSETNKPRLLGEEFNQYLIEEIYNNYIEDSIKYIKARYKYKKQFNYLEKDFHIKHAEMACMASIEWGSLFGRNCLEMILLDSLISKQIQFSTVFSKLQLFHSPKSVLRNKEKVLSQLQDNPVYQYSVRYDNCLGEIHWVQSKSLSGIAKRNFLRDVKDNGESKSVYKGKFRKAVFFELTEDRDRKRSFSRWILFKDGTNVLWQLQGDYLMNMSDRIVEKQGYVCYKVSPDEF